MSASSHSHMCGLHSSQPRHLSLLHYLGAALSFTCICFYTIMLTELTRRCVLTRFERFLYPFRIVSTILQICFTICCILLETFVCGVPHTVIELTSTDWHFCHFSVRLSHSQFRSAALFVKWDQPWVHVAEVETNDSAHLVLLPSNTRKLDVEHVSLSWSWILVARCLRSSCYSLLKPTRHGRFTVLWHSFQRLQKAK